MRTPARAPLERTENGAREEAYRFLARAARSTAEMRAHLARRGFAPGHADAAVEVLIANRYLDDASLALRRAEEMLLRRGWGRRRTAFELTRRGFADSVVSDAITAIHEQHDETELARRALHRKFPRGSSRSLEDRGRAFRFLSGRGFPVDVVTQILGESPDD